MVFPAAGGLNIAHECVDRHAASSRADRTALRYIGRHDAVRTVTYGQLRDDTNRFANVLAGLGVKQGDREWDYPQIASIDGCVTYLATRVVAVSGELTR
jgi:acyl-coenzyme A synthetase/AMP-(fatty) acid ligase